MAIAKALTGSKHSAETKEKIGAAHRGKTVSDEAKAKVGLANSQPVVETTSGTWYPSVKVAAQELGVCERSLSRVLTGHFSQTGGYSFKYA